MPDGGEREAFLTADYNAEMIEHVARYPARARPRDLRRRSRRHRARTSSAPGCPDPRLDRGALRLRRLRDRLRPGRARATASGCAPSSASPGRAGVHRLRRRLGRRRAPAAPRDRRASRGERRVPGLRMVVVAGPRIDPASLPRADGLEVRALRARPLPPPRRVRPRGRAGRPDHVHGADGEPAAVPLLPARHHFEQNFHVRHRLERYGAGARMDFATDARRDRRRDRRGDRPRRRLPAGRPGRRRPRRGSIGELL